jgi:hypothetical protein
MNYNSLTEWECERSILVTCPSLLPETCEILCRESKTEGSHVKWHTCEGWLLRTGVPAPLKICEHTRKDKMQLWVFCPLYLCPWLVVGGDMDPETFPGGYASGGRMVVHWQIWACQYVKTQSSMWCWGMDTVKLQKTLPIGIWHTLMERVTSHDYEG